MYRLAEIESFVAVVEEGGFTAAANRLGVSKSHVSKQVAALEHRLGVQLLNRTTRKIALTDAGAAFSERALRALEDLNEAEESVVQLTAQPRGLLKMSMPMTFGLIYVSPLIAELLNENPELNVDLDFSDRNVDVLGEGFDLVIRVGELSDSSLVARRLAPVKARMVASPAYLREHGAPQHPSELSDHTLLEYAYTSATQLKLTKGDETVFVPVRSRVRANNGGALKDAALAGLGIVPLPDFMVFEELKKGSLVPVLDGWMDGDRAVWALYPQNRYLSAKVRVCVDFLAEKLSKVPWS